MPSDTEEALLLETFLQGSATFEEIAKNFDDPVECYLTLLESAKTSLETFDEYLEFYQACIDEGPTEFVYSNLNRNAVRSLKNMAIQESEAGRRFPVHSVTELETRIEAYRDLGVDVSSHTVISTILEHIFDNHTDYVYTLSDSLLDASNEPSAATKLLVHTRFVAATQTLDRRTDAFNNYINQFVSTLPDPRPTDERSADELWNASQQTPYKNPEKVDLAQASLVREPNVSRLCEYLYLSARDIVERYRHDDRDQPHRGELQLALRQINVLLTRFDDELPTERTTRLQSYRKVVLGQLRSGNWWQSQRETATRPEPKFLKAASHFYEAAQLIKSVDTNRYIKYFSKAIRNQATATEQREYGPAVGWEVSHRLHMTAGDLLPTLVSEPDNKALETINETIALHRCLGYQAGAVAACISGDPERIKVQVNHAWDLIERVPIYIDTEFFEALKTVADGFEYEQEDAFADAIHCYESVDLYQKQIPLKKRQKLTEIKSEIVLEEYERAIKIAEDAFGERSPIVEAVKTVSGESPEPPRLKDEEFHQIIGASSDVLWSFAMFIHLVGQIDKPDPSLQLKIENLLLDL